MILNWLVTARLAGQVKRTHIVPTIQSYTVGDHTYNAMLIASELCKINEGVREEIVLKYLLTHDVEEVYTGDLPAYVKKHEGLKYAVDRIEEEWRTSNVPEHHSNYNLTPQEKKISKLSDCSELVMFCIDELDMGNRHPALIKMCYRAKDYMNEYAVDINTGGIVFQLTNIINLRLKK